MLSEGGSRIYGGDGYDEIFLGQGDRVVGSAGKDSFFVVSSGNNVITSC
ncbi:MAG: hypothetical protein QNJ54_02215 [Prochloraceae cyanobacterium]|nr:hypothetical protein [Prochloraceae cyanobacterium]